MEMSYAQVTRAPDKLGTIFSLTTQVDGLVQTLARLHIAISSASDSDCRSRVCQFESQLSHITFVKIDHEIISTVILPLLLIQEGQLSVTGQSMCIVLMNPLKTE